MEYSCLVDIIYFLVTYGIRTHRFAGESATDWDGYWAKTRWRSILMSPDGAAWKPSKCGPRPTHRSRVPAPTSSRWRCWNGRSNCTTGSFHLSNCCRSSTNWCWRCRQTLLRPSSRWLRKQGQSQTERKQSNLPKTSPLNRGKHLNYIYQWTMPKKYSIKQGTILIQKQRRKKHSASYQ